MPIKMRCSCGKVLKTSDSGAGRRVKCPACGQVNRMPGSRGQPEVSSADDCDVKPIAPAALRDAEPPPPTQNPPRDHEPPPLAVPPDDFESPVPAVVTPEPADDPAPVQSSPLDDDLSDLPKLRPVTQEIRVSSYDEEEDDGPEFYALADDSAAKGEGKICPWCKAQIVAEAVLCVECGTNLQTGERLAVHFEPGVKEKKE